MAKPKRKLTAREKAARKLRAARYMTIFINGKQKRVERPVLIEGMPEDDFLRANADPIWLHQEGLWELMPENWELDEPGAVAASTGRNSLPKDEIPF